MIRTWTLLAFVLLSSALEAQTSFPMIARTHPVALQRGKTTEVTVEGTQNFHGAYLALFEGAGIKAEIATSPTSSQVPPPMVASVKVKVTVDADAPRGV